jgi:hypothetical protein
MPSPPRSCFTWNDLNGRVATLSQREFAQTTHIESPGIDLNNDGMADAFVTGHSCGSGGCEYEVYLSDGPCLRFAGANIFLTYRIEPLTTFHNGARDLRAWGVNKPAGQPIPDPSTVFEFDGVMYTQAASAQVPR